jgi:regulator of protease activity HflC (stomatin/prohibitin superfamily)
MTRQISGMILLLALLTSCTIVRPGQVGMRQTLGKLKESPHGPGAMFFNPFATRIIKINTRTVELFNVLPLPTKEGLSVNAEISLLYHPDPTKIAEIYKRYGINYEEVIVLSNFRATAREISARYAAKELYATERQKVENAIMDELVKHIGQAGFVIDAVLLKDIDLPPQMMAAIESKVTAEQAALQMEFVIDKQKKEAERMIIEAEGVKKAQDIINSSLTEKQLQYNQIEMLKGLVNSPNTKIVITGSGGNTPMILNTDGQ